MSETKIATPENGRLGVPAETLSTAKKLVQTGHTDFAVPSVKDCRTQEEDNLTEAVGFVSCPANQGKFIDRNYCAPDRCPFSHRQFSSTPLPNHMDDREVFVKNYPWPEELKTFRTDILQPKGESLNPIIEVQKLTLYCMRPKPVQEVHGWKEGK